MLIALAAPAAACGGEAAVVENPFAADTTVAPNTAAPTTTVAVTTSAAPTETTTTVVVAEPRLVEIVDEAPPWEDVTLLTEDEIELNAKFWAGGSTGVIVGHDFDITTIGSGGERPPQSSDNVLPWAATLASEGLTVLSPDFRGHGLSAGELDVPNSTRDLKAAFGFLRDRGVARVVMVGFVGSGTSAVVLDAMDDDLDFSGIALLFSPPQDHGLDANAVLPDLETPAWFVGYNPAQSASWAVRMSNAALNSYGFWKIEQIPTGLQFIDVFGPELAGRLMDFIDDVTA